MNISRPPSNSFSCTLKWASWALIAIFCFYEFALSLFPSIISERMQNTLSPGSENIEIILQLFFYLYIPTQVPIGAWLVRFGKSFLIFSLVFFCSINLYVFLFASEEPFFMLLRLIAGMGSTFIHVGMLSYLIKMFSGLSLGMVLSFINAFAFIGVVYGKSLGTLAHIFNHQNTILVLEILGLFICLFLLWMSPYFSSLDRVRKAKENVFCSKWKWSTFKTNWIHPRYWGKALMICLFYLITSSFGTPIGIAFFRHSYGFHRELAGFATSLIYIEWIFDRSFVGHLTDHLGFRRFFIMIGSLLGLVCLSPFMAIPSLLFVFLSTLLFLLGLSSPPISLSLPIETKIDTPFANTFAFGGAIFQPFLGLMLDLFWAGGEGGEVGDPLPMLMLLPLGCLFAGCLKKYNQKKERKKMLLYSRYYN